MASMWGDVERTIENRKDAIDRQRLYSLEKLLEEKHREVDKISRELERTQKVVERERLKASKVEESLVAERSRQEGFEAKIKRLEARAESAEAEVSLQEAGLVEMGDLRSKLRVSEQAGAALRAQIGTERQRAEECSRALSDAHDRFSRELSSKGSVETKAAVLERENAAFKQEASSARAEAELLRERCEKLMNAASSDAESLQARAKQLEFRLERADTASEKLEHMIADIDTANARARELARQLAVEKTERGTVESLAKHQAGVIEDLKQQLEKLKSASALLAGRQEQAELSLLMVRTGYSPAREEETITGVKRQLALERREHAVLKMQHEEVSRQLGAMRELHDPPKPHTASHSPTHSGARPAYSSPLQGERPYPHTHTSPIVTPPHPRYPSQGAYDCRTPASPQDSAPVWEVPNTQGAKLSLSLSVQEEVPSQASIRPAVSSTAKNLAASVLGHTHPHYGSKLGGAQPKFPTVTPPPTARLAAAADDAASDCSFTEDSPRTKRLSGSEAMVRRAAILDAQDTATVATTTPVTSRLEALVSHQKQLAMQKNTFLMPTGWVSDASRAPAGSD